MLLPKEFNLPVFKLTLKSPGIHKQILQTDLHTFPYKISWQNFLKDQSTVSSGHNFINSNTLFLLIIFGYCWEKVDVGHYWNLKS